ncbi:MAG: MBL fold metallo-hydrolase, partial [Euryarchaeota archaeon]|nr:MBL fold metallo-hydrolase [Euryarchaeota archaeon]
MVVKLEFLGSGNAFLPQGRFHSLLLIDDSILIDCPPTALSSLRRIELSPSKLNSIMFTHWHGDHVFGFPFVILERKWISDRSGVEPLGIHGPKGCKERLSALCETAYPGSMDDRLKEFDWDESSNGNIMNNPKWKFERFAVEHDVEVDPHGYVLTHSSGLSVMHTGDSGPCEAIESRVGRCDVVVIEMGVPDYVQFSQHYSPKSILNIAQINPNTVFL